MADKEDKKYRVGYKKPPRHTQFKPGQSGNPHGRPKKADSVADVLHRELNARITVVMDGKRQTISMIRAVFKQNLNKAVKGDPKAAAILFNALKSFKPDVGGDNLDTLVQEFRAAHLRHEAADKDRSDAGAAKSDHSSAGGQDPKTFD